ncbi:blue copper protein-like protein, partial [Tanacetum coccineum]
TKDTKMAAYNVALVGMMVMLSCVTLSFAKVYTVGDSAGWALAVDYNTWASDKTFRVGDKLGKHFLDFYRLYDLVTDAITFVGLLSFLPLNPQEIVTQNVINLLCFLLLVFNYDSSHTVDLVSSTDYAACAIGNSIASYNTGTTTIALNTTGSHYFICGIMGHCTGGMQLTVKVTSSDDISPSTAPLAAPSPLTADSPTATPFGNTLPNPTLAGSGNNIPVDSSAQAVSPFVGFVFGLVALILA